MGVHLLFVREPAESIEHAIMFDSVSGNAFGPMFESIDEAEDCLAWFGSGDAAKVADGLGIASIGNDDDPRGYKPGDLRTLVDEWRARVKAGLV